MTTSLLRIVPVLLMLLVVFAPHSAVSADLADQVDIINYRLDHDVPRVDIFFKPDSLPTYTAGFENLDNWSVWANGKRLNVQKAKPFPASGKVHSLFLWITERTEYAVRVSYQGVPLADPVDPITEQEALTQKIRSDASFSGIDISRLLSQKPDMRLKYELDATLAGISVGPKAQYDIDLAVTSNGVLVTDAGVENGTQSSVGLRFTGLMWETNWARPLYRIELDYAVETSAEAKTESDNPSLIALRNQAGVIGVTFDFPGSNLMRRYWKLDFVRQTPFLRFGLRYWFDSDADLSTKQATLSNQQVERSTARLEYSAEWELPFSKFFILDMKGTYNNLEDTYRYTRLRTGEPVQVVKVDDASWYRVRVGQTADAFVSAFAAFLPFVEKAGYDVSSNNFIYFEYSDGRMAPDFIDRTERKIGVSLTF